MSSSKPVVLITGATSGIGRHAALYLAKRGCQVIGVGRNKQAVGSLKKEGADHDVWGFAMDVTDPSTIKSVKEKVDKLTDGYGVDVLVNNAGMAQPGAVLDYTVDELRAQFEVNLFGLHEVTRTFAPDMVARGSGRIINISSISGRTSLPFVSAYHASKHALETYSDSLRMELHAFGVYVSIVEPGPIKSNIADVTFPKIDELKERTTYYAEQYDRALEFREKFMERVADTVETSRVIAHAALARTPQVRYVVPQARIPEVLLFEWVPSRIVDAVAAKVMGLDKPASKQAPFKADTAGDAGK